jgi:hypothetical protein
VGVYGDGSDGAVTVSSTADWTQSPPATTLQFTSFAVSAGVTLTVPSGTVIRATGNVTISGIIVVAKVWYAGMGAATSAALCDTSGTQPGIYGLGLGDANALIARQLVNPGRRGGGGGGCESLGYGGQGGGTLVILASGAITISSGGSIRANGTAGLDGTPGHNGGGGGGGIIVLASRTSIANSGTLSVQGGGGGSLNSSNCGGNQASTGGGGGGGGLINLLAPSISAGTASVGGGAGGSGWTGATGCGGGGGGSYGDGGFSGAGGINGSAGAPGAVLTTMIQDPSTLFAPAAGSN